MDASLQGWLFNWAKYICLRLARTCAEFSASTGSLFTLVPGFKMWFPKQKIIFQDVALSFWSWPFLYFLSRMSFVIQPYSASSAASLPHQPASAGFWQEGEHLCPLLCRQRMPHRRWHPSLRQNTERSFSKLPCLAQKQLGSRKAVFPGKSSFAGVGNRVCSAPQSQTCMLR